MYHRLGFAADARPLRVRARYSSRRLLAEAVSRRVVSRARRAGSFLYVYLSIGRDRSDDRYRVTCDLMRVSNVPDMWT